MVKQRKAEKPQREFTRRQLSQWQRQRRRQHLILGVGISVIAAVILIVLVGWYLGEYRPLHRTAIRVNDTEFDVGYYVDALKSTGAGQSVDYIPSLAEGIIGEIERNELIRQEAWRLGISVSDDEIKEAPAGSGMRWNDASLDLVRSQMLQERLYNEYFKPQVPASGEQVHIMAMLLAGESQAAEIRTRLQGSDNFTALAEEFSLDAYSKSNQGDLGWHPESILAVALGSSVPGEYAFGSEGGVLSQPRYDEGVSKGVGYWLIRVLAKEYEEEAQVQAVLLGSEDEASDVRARLEAGEDLAALAAALSQYDESRKQGGALGLVGQGDISPAFDEYIFNPEVAVGEWSEPILDDTMVTGGGYWLIEVLDRDDDRQLDEGDREYLINKIFNEWLSLLWADAGDNVDDSYLDDATKQWAIERVMKGLN